MCAVGCAGDSISIYSWSDYFSRTEEAGENNRRKYQLSLTEKGRAVALKIMDLNNEWENQIYSTCNTDEKQIVELMRKITISSINIQKNTQKEEKNG